MMLISNRILSGMVDTIRFRIRIRTKIWKQIWYQWYPSVSNPSLSLLEIQKISYILVTVQFKGTNTYGYHTQWVRVWMQNINYVLLPPSHNTRRSRSGRHYQERWQMTCMPLLHWFLCSPTFISPALLSCSSSRSTGHSRGAGVGKQASLRARRSGSAPLQGTTCLLVGPRRSQGPPYPRSWPHRRRRPRGLVTAAPAIRLSARCRRWGKWLSQPLLLVGKGPPPALLVVGRRGRCCWWRKGPLRPGAAMRAASAPGVGTEEAPWPPGKQVGAAQRHGRQPCLETGRFGSEHMETRWGGGGVGDGRCYFFTSLFV
jgi:hypothetical protein